MDLLKGDRMAQLLDPLIRVIAPHWIAFCLRSATWANRHFVVVIFRRNEKLLD